MNKFFQILIIIIFISVSSMAQTGENNTCETALPFCTGTNYSFPAGTTSQNAQIGPYYGCLTTTPSPAWYYMRIANPGSITIKMYSTPAHDIDYCCWGPFDSQSACNQLTSGKIVSCSYSTASTEYCTIASAVAGKYYILIITNYSQQPCNINFSQTGGTGTTDCTILPPPCGNNGPLCVGETLRLGAQAVNGATYHWVGPDGWTSNIQNPTRANMQMSMAGQYALAITVNGTTSDPTFTEVLLSPPPTASLSGDATICSGESADLILTCQNSGPWTVHYSLNGGQPVSVQVTSSPYNLSVSPSTSSVYKLTEVSNAVCSVPANDSATIIVNPSPVSDFSHNNHCQGYGTQFTDNSTPGGIVSTWLWDFNDGGNTSNIQNPNYTFSHAGAFNVILTVTTADGCEGSKTQVVNILPTPEPNAGSDKSIPYGTNTSLSGSASGGTGSFSYHWEPATLLANPDIPSPTTVQLTQTTDFTLTVTDNGNACQKSDVMTVTITGGPVGVQIIATPTAVCPGEPVSLNAQASGGSGNYSYSWVSDPAGFTSSIEDVTVEPTVTTTYHVTVSDGFNTSTYSKLVTVYDLPVVIAGSDQTIPNGTPANLYGSATSGQYPYSFRWEPSDKVLDANQAATSTIYLENTTGFTLTVTDGHGCVSTDQVQITISGGPLAVNPESENSPICKGTATRLHALGEGGAGNYSYNWISNPSGFSSQEANPIVAPIVTTTYTITISDGFNSRQGNVTVVVNQLPEINLIPQGSHILAVDTIEACIYDTLTINAANANVNYLWSNGATTPSIQSSTTGIGFDMQTFGVHLVNTLTGCENSHSITILFTYAECTYGIDEESPEQIFVYPIPANENIFIKVKDNIHELLYELCDMQGRVILSGHLETSVNTGSINIGELQHGIYLLRIMNKESIRVMKVIKR
jgi:PKD repeat protein